MRRLLLLLLLLSGCAGQRSAPANLLGGMSFEGRMWLLDAEEELAVAQARLEQGQIDLARAQDSLREAEQRMSTLGGDDAAEDGSVATLAAKEAKGQLLYARAGEALAAENVEVAAAGLGCARARYELAKVEVAQKLKVAGSEEVDAEEFQKQAHACEKNLSKREEKLRDLADVRSHAKVSWERRKVALTKKSRVARPGPYVE